MGRYKLVLAFSICLPGIGGIGLADTSFPTLSPALREQIDQFAQLQPTESVAQEHLNQMGRVSHWLLSQVRLPSDIEIARAREQQLSLKMAYRGVAPTPEVARLLNHLAQGLPAHLRPATGSWTLVVLEEPGYRARAQGAGYLTISQSYLDALRKEPKRGQAALAFVLAEQMAHTALGHCRRGWQRVDLETRLQQEVQGLFTSLQLQQTLQTGIQISGRFVEFLYSKDQHYLADLLALQLLQEAGVANDAALDSLRFLAALRHPLLLRHQEHPNLARLTPTVSSTLAYLFQDRPDPLWRLKRLLQEVKGLVSDLDSFGLFRQQLTPDGRLTTHCRESKLNIPDNKVQKRQKHQKHQKGQKGQPIILIHGMLGGSESLREIARACATEPSLKERPLYCFRYPGNGSLSCGASFLYQEVVRVLGKEATPLFICHSAGGLVFRCYAELHRGPFERAIFLGTPHYGSNLVDLKALADLSDVWSSLGAGVGPALSRLAAEGRGEIILDLHPQSIFLRRLQRNWEQNQEQSKQLARRYHIVVSSYLSTSRQLVLQLAFPTVRNALRGQIERFPEGWLRKEFTEVLTRLHLPEEFLRGDMIVSARSARLAEAGRVTHVQLDHLALRTDPALIRQILNWMIE